MTNIYWNKYYSEHNTPFEPSNFAKFIFKFIDKEKTIIDIGCGNGRDSFYFARKKLETLGIDYSDVTINNLKQNSKDNLDFQVLNIEHINKELENVSIDICYCRFILHSFNEKVESALFEWIKNSNVSILCIETRVEEDIYSISTQDHYRRPINELELKAKIKDIDFEIIFDKKSNKFSRYKKEYGVKDLKNDPMLLRIIARRLN